MTSPEHIAGNVLRSARYKTAVAQVIPSAVDTLIDFDSRDFDPYGEVTTGVAWKYTVTSDGIYTVGASLKSDVCVVGNGQQQIITLYKNGAPLTIIADTVYPRGISPSGTYTSAAGSSLVSLVRGDYIHVCYYQDSGIAHSLFPDSTVNHISIARIGRA